MRRKKEIIYFLSLLITIATLVTVNAVGKTTDSFAALSFNPESYDFGEKTKGEQVSTTFEIWNSDCCTLSYFLTANKDWIEVNPAEGYSTGEHDIITVTVDTKNLETGINQGNISIQTNSGDGEFSINITILEPDYIDITSEQAWMFLSNISNEKQIPIDVRTESEWKDEHIDTPYPEHPRHHNYFEWSNPSILNKILSTFQGKEIILYCAAGGRSKSAAQLLADNKFDGTIYNMLGGFKDWKNKGYPTIGYTDLQNKNISGGFGSISFKIKNIGEFTAENISSEIKIKGGILSLVNLTYQINNKDAVIEKDSEINLNTKNQGFILGFGKINITISTWAKNSDKTTTFKDAFLLGIYILI